APLILFELDADIRLSAHVYASNVEQLRTAAATRRRVRDCQTLPPLADPYRQRSIQTRPLGYSMPRRGGDGQGRRADGGQTAGRRRADGAMGTRGPAHCPTWRSPAKPGDALGADDAHISGVVIAEAVADDKGVAARAAERAQGEDDALAGAERA